MHIISDFHHHHPPPHHHHVHYFFIIDYSTHFLMWLVGGRKLPGRLNHIHPVKKK